MVFKDPIFGVPMVPEPEEHVRLTPTEHKAEVLMLNEHRQHKCGRCLRRFDFPDGGYICQRALHAKAVMQGTRLCGKFILDEDQSTWREDL